MAHSAAKSIKNTRKTSDLALPFGQSQTLIKTMENQHFHRKMCHRRVPLPAQSGPGPGAGILWLALLWPEPESCGKTRPCLSGLDFSSIHIKLHLTSGPNGVAKHTSGPIGQTASSMGGMHINQWKNSEKYHKSIDMQFGFLFVGVVCKLFCAAVP